MEHEKAQSSAVASQTRGAGEAAGSAPAGGGAAAAFTGYVQQQMGDRPVVRLGSRGPWVQSLQQALNGQGESLDADGIFGPMTRAAVVRFQQARTLSPDGIVGPITWGALDAPGRKPKKDDPPQPGGQTEGALTLVERKSLAEGYSGFIGEVAQAHPAAATALAPAVQQTATLLALGKDPEDQAMADVLTVIAVGLPPALEATPTAPPPAPVQHDCLDALHRWVSQAFSGGPPPKITAYLGRIENMRAFYGSLAGKDAGMPVQSGPADAYASGRAAMAGLALGEVGKVKAKAPLTDQDEQGKPARPGWRDLKKYFDTAFGGEYANQPLLRHPVDGNVPQKKDEQGNWVYEYKTDVLPHWCGIFATWAAKTAGLPIGNWAVGTGVSSSLQNTKIPQVGDVAYRNSMQHHAVVVWVQPHDPATLGPTGHRSLQVRTVDGNSGTQSEVTGPNTSTVGDWATFYTYR